MKDFDYSALSNPVWSLPTIHLRDPAVYVENDLAYVFFTYYDPQQSTWHVGLAATRDFINYSEISLVSPAGYASPGNVIKTDRGYALCYQQYKEFPHYLCLAWSDDLKHFSEPEKIFNTGDDNVWNADGRVIDPYMVQWQGRYYCYYVGSTRWGKASGHNLIGVVGSDDLRTWRDLSPDAPVIGVDYEWEQPDGNENNCVVRHNDRWVMLYSASLKNQQIAWAVSDDLIHWDKQGLCNVPVCDASERSFGAPFVIEGLTGDDTYHMIYQGQDANEHMSFLMLESKDLVNWY